MVVNEQYLLYRFSDDLVRNHQYNIFYINAKSDEIWLEKKEKGKTKLIRLIHKGFDWKNHLKNDIAFLFQRVKNIKNVFKKNIEIYNVYFTEHPPVDSWEVLKKPLIPKGKPKMVMNTYYLDGEDYLSETERFQNDLMIETIDYELDLTEEEKALATSATKQQLIAIVKNKRQEMSNLFNYGKPLFTYVILALCIIGFALLELNGGSMSIETLVTYGAKYNPAMIIDGEWWRLVTSMFLHIGFLHLLLNGVALYYLGGAVEKIFGSGRFLLIYFISGIGGSLASFAYSTSVSAGASGAIFGLFGALIYFGTRYRKIFIETIGPSLIFVIAINLVLGFFVDGIDLAAHTGGLIFGFFSAAIVSLPKKTVYKKQLLATFITLLSIGGLTLYGLQVNASSEAYRLQELQYYLQEESYVEVVEIATEALEVSVEWKSLILFHRAYAYIELDEPEKAIVDLEKSITYDDALPESYYNLVLLYQLNGEEQAAYDMIEQAYERHPMNENLIILYEEITEKVVD